MVRAVQRYFQTQDTGFWAVIVDIKDYNNDNYALSVSVAE